MKKRLALLFALILRAVSFEFRDKVENDVWRAIWDIVHFFANLVPAILLGVAFANLFKGIPVDADGVFHGTLLSLLNSPAEVVPLQGWADCRGGLLLAA